MLNELETLRDRVTHLEHIVKRLTAKLNNAEANCAHRTRTETVKVNIDTSQVDAAIVAIEQAVAQIKSRKRGK